MKKSDTELTFLDTIVYKGPQFLDTGFLDVRNPQLYILKTSYHPNSVKIAIPKGETQRYLHSNTREDTFIHVTRKLKQNSSKEAINLAYSPKSLVSHLKREVRS